jgi:hypothetical protein
VGRLSNAITDDARRRRIVDDGVRLIEDEVRSKKGLSGLAVKAGFKVIKAFKPNILPMAMNELLDDFAIQIDPFYDRFEASGGSDLGVYFSQNSGELANALLSITDARANKSPHATLRKAYGRLRPQAVGHVSDALPRVGQMVQRHVA